MSKIPTDEIFYTGELNEKRITAYKKLAENYRVQEGTVRDIFSQGITFAVSHTAAHTAGLQDRIKELENSRNDFENAAYKSTMDLKRLVAKYDGLSRRFKEMEAENARYRDRIGEALKFLQWCAGYYS